MAEFVKNNSEKTAMTFYKKTVFNGVMQEKKINNSKNLIDFNFGEKIYYGRVNMYHTPVTVHHKRIKHFPLNMVNGENSKFGAVNFVTDAFIEMTKQFDKARMTGKISSDHDYLSTLKVYRAYENPNVAFQNYYKIYSNSIASAMQSDGDLPFQNFDEFIPLFMSRISNVILTHPFTRTGYIKSKYCSILSSGLAIEIADHPYSNDQAKMDDFVNSKNWEFYVKTCSTYGFLVDRNIPWRIVADIGNPQFLRTFAKTYGLGASKQSLFNRYFDLVHERYFVAFKTYLFNLYDRARNFDFRQDTQCGDVKVISTQAYTEELFDALYDDEYFLKLYFKIRLMEEESSLSQHEQQNLINEMISFYNRKNKNLKRCLYFFEFIVNKSFDRVGSLSYINAARKAREAEERNHFNNRRRTDEIFPANNKETDRSIDGVPEGPGPTDTMGDDHPLRSPFDKFPRTSNGTSTGTTSGSDTSTGGSGGGY